MDVWWEFWGEWHQNSLSFSGQNKMLRELFFLLLSNLKIECVWRSVT